MPDAAVTTAAWLLTAVFAIAATTKLRDPLGTRRSLGDFGLPNPRLLAQILPATEVATALLLVVDPRLGGQCAVALLVAFTTLIVGRLVAGHRDACGCFGTWSQRPLSWRDLARNGLLIALSVIAALG
ncbi:MAG: MauE/DoxX family redox-associated membrane protein [Actinomycetota bacterium]|nr:MauE/DoxX family redox-associated membrane protein [Actinomycetota bacterium]MED5397017.1 MauE/DoxX family redox-associated membrane protein [Actinomycetota bacterium]MED6330054.1 MauE/DoxX family redox-associated membrane protein [Actinomycetota bacterium]